MKARVGLIRVLTLKDDQRLNAHGRLIESHFPHLSVNSACIADQPEGIYNEQTIQTAIPKIVELGKKMAKDNLRAIVVSCADDPGVAELRKIVNIPVIGAGSAAARMSLTLGSRIGTLGISETTPEIMKEVLGKHLVAESRPEGVRTTLDLMTDEGIRSAITAAEDLRSRGADVIVLSCTGYSTIGLADRLANVLRMPVVDPVIASGSSASDLVSQS